MSSKDVKKLIITLIILGIGINILAYIGKNFISRLPVTRSTDLTPAITNLTNLLSIGIVIIIIVLIPVYLSRRSDEKKKTQEY